MVDDLEANRNLVCKLLKQQNYQLIVACDGSEALEILQGAKPDLILLDVGMPNLDGLEVCRRIRKMQRFDDVPVLFLTGRTDPADVAKGFEAGAVDYIGKPVNVVELIARVKTHLDLKLTRDRLIINNVELRALNSRKNRFFSIIAHDLKGSFSVFLNVCDLLHMYLQKEDTSKILSIAARVTESAGRLNNLLNNLLDWTRMQMNQVCFEPSNVKISEVCQDAVDSLQEQIQSKEIRVKLEVPEDIEGFFDRNMILTVVRNLIGNAIKYSKVAGAIRIAYQPEEGFHRI